MMVALCLASVIAGCGAARQHRQIQQQGEALRFELAELYVARGAHQAAVPLLQKVLADAPEDVRARILYGSVLRDQGLYPQAERELRFAVRRAPEEPAAHAALGVLLDLTERHAEALRAHHRAVALAPGRAAFHNNLGFSLYLAGRTDEAIAALERALALDPALAVAYGNLGFAYGRAGRFADAERTFRAALGEAAALLNLALVHEEHGDDATTAALRARAYAIDPDLRPAPLPTAAVHDTKGTTP